MNRFPPNLSPELPRGRAAAAPREGRALPLSASVIRGVLLVAAMVGPTGCGTPPPATPAALPSLTPVPSPTTAVLTPAATASPAVASFTPVPWLALVSGKTTTFASISGEDGVGSVDAGVRYGTPLRALAGLRDGRFAILDENGGLVAGLPADLRNETATRLPFIPVGTGLFLASVRPWGDGGLVVLLTSDHGAELVTLDAAGATVNRRRIPVAIEGSLAPIDEGRALVVHRDTRDRAVIAIIGPGGLDETGVQAYDVDVARATVAIVERPDRLRVGSLADLLAGRSPAVMLTGPGGVGGEGAGVDRIALAPDGSRLLATWRDVDDVIRWATIDERDPSGSWVRVLRAELPAGLDRALPAWGR